MGYTTTRVNNVEQWDGSSWTEIAEANTTRYSMAVTVGTPVNSVLILVVNHLQLLVKITQNFGMELLGQS